MEILAAEGGERDGLKNFDFNELSSVIVHLPCPPCEIKEYVRGEGQINRGHHDHDHHRF